jgi:ribose-phosphate pyrophosphokinase
MKTKLTIHTSEGMLTRDVVLSEFPDKDAYCLIENTDGISGNHVLIVHDLYRNQNERIVQLLILVDLLSDLKAKSISVFAPYLPYARQDKRHLPGEAISAETLSKTLYRAGVTTLYTFDCHFMKGAPSTTHQGLHIVNITLGPYLIDYFKTNITDSICEVISPDKGASYFVKEYGSKSMHKERGGYDADPSVRHRSVHKLEHEHLQLNNDKPVVIIDDMISTGGTMLKAVQNLQANGISDVYCIAVHGLFLNGSYEKLTEAAKRVIVSDTLPCATSVPVVAKAWQERGEPSWSAYCEAN